MRLQLFIGENPRDLRVVCVTADGSLSEPLAGVRDIKLVRDWEAHGTDAYELTVTVIIKDPGKKT